MSNEDPRFYTNVNDIPWFQEAVRKAKLTLENHNHVTREIRPAGECYGCDRYHAKTLAREVEDLRNIIFGTLQEAEESNQTNALRYLTMEAQGRNIYRFDNNQ